MERCSSCGSRELPWLVAAEKRCVEYLNMLPAHPPGKTEVTSRVVARVEACTSFGDLIDIWYPEIVLAWS